MRGERGVISVLYISFLCTSFSFCFLTNKRVGTEVAVRIPCQHTVRKIRQLVILLLNPPTLAIISFAYALN